MRASRNKTRIRKPKRELVVTALLFLLALPQLTAALNPERLPSQYLFERYGRDSGLPSDTIWTSREGPNGYLWIGTRAGLARFDGSRFKVFNSLTHPAFTANDVRDLEWTPSGELYIATYGAGVLIKRGTIFEKLDKSEGLADNIVYDIHRARNGAIWFATGEGVSRLLNDELRSWTTDDGLGANRVLRVAEAADGTIWVAGLFGGTSYFNGTGFTSFDANSGLDSSQIHLLSSDAEEGIMVGTATGKVYALSKTAPPRELAWSQAFPIQESLRDSDGNHWVGTYGKGLWRHNSEEFVPVVPPRDDQLTHIYNLYEDTSGNLWASSTSGLYRVTDSVFSAVGANEGLSNSTFVVTAANKGGLWVGTESTGLFHLAADGAATQPIQALRDKDISSLMQRENGDLWVGTFGEGIFVHSPDSGELTRLDAASGLSSPHVFSLAETDLGEVWIGAGNGVFRWSPSSAQSIERQTPFGEWAFRHIQQSANGSLWFSSDSGIFERRVDGSLQCWDQEQGLSSNVVTASLEDDRGIIWIITRDGGLARLESGSLFTYGADNGFQMLSAFGILEDRARNLWISGGTGLLRVSRDDLDAIARGEPRTLRAKNFDENDGLRTGQFIGGYQPSAWVDATNRLWFVSARGLTGINPKEFPDKTASLNAVIETVRVDGIEIPLQEPLQLPANFRNLEIDYSAPELSGATSLRFRYTNSAQENLWENVGGRRTAYYTNLPPGPGVFRVQATLGDKPFSDQAERTAQLRYVRETRWYETTWSVLIASVLAILTLTIIQSLLSQRARVRESELRELVGLRTEELRKALERVEASARIDGLTGVANRRFMEEQLTALWNMARRSGAPISILMLDIDRFKQYNDALGHHAGDNCLKLIANAISDRLLREHDMVARYGGEEFLVMLYDSDETGALGAAQRIMECVQALAIPHPDSDIAEYVTLSLGYATEYAKQDSQVYALVERADKALYEAKNSGRNRICQATPS